ncbi:tyrosine-type recombinase/integrase [Cognatishimia activa]|uniref:Integrase arm-type DNA-binding domain-containing protein n=1 Tax=Cognatishimia activa TaxID=1715691 RepID=A0A975EMN5_9RHOB|nr:site-specific integrase [Cognatishimia activa]QTN34844.1 integrase arm-type DNA-binding domain-containing protein [Cognatishimia activa]
MGHSLNKLSATFIKSAPVGKHSDGGGLWLHKRPDGGSQWFLRVSVHGRRREMGLGSPPTISLKHARQEAQRWRSFAKSGVDPIKQREKERREAERNLHILSDVASDCFEARKAELKGDGKAGRWFSPLELHVLPKLGRIPIAEIDQRDIRDALAPIWHEKVETAKKALNRLSICMHHGAALGLDVDLQAADKAKALLGAQRKKVKHTPFMRWQDVPEFYASLDGDTVTHLALKLLILTVGTRTRPLRFLRLDQIDSDVWTVAADDMKGRIGTTNDFRVPLSTQALDLICRAEPMARDGYLFPSQRKGVISDATMSRLMDRRGLEARPHGFRSSFRTWCAEQTDTPREVAEACLAHVTGTAVERAYRRTDYLDQRRRIMQRWADHVTGSA